MRQTKNDDLVVRQTIKDLQPKVTLEHVSLLKPYTANILLNKSNSS